MIKVGDRFRIKDNDLMIDEYRNKPFTVTAIKPLVYEILLDDNDQSYSIDKNEWSEIVEKLNSWHGNILFHKFI